MTCPKCDGEVRNVATVHKVDTNEVYRRKKCLKCGHIFYTIEFEVEITKRFKKEWNRGLYEQNNKIAKYKIP